MITIVCRYGLANYTIRDDHNVQVAAGTLMVSDEQSDWSVSVCLSVCLPACHTFLSAIFGHNSQAQYW